MKLEERELEEIIMNTPNKELQERGLDIWGDKQNQIQLGSYGILDVLTSYYEDVFNVEHRKIIGSNLNLNLYELKSGKIGIDTLMQACRYAKGIQRHYEHVDCLFEITLIGTEVEKNSEFVYLSDIFYNMVNDEETNVYGFNFKKLNIVTVGYDVNGINFKYHSDYSLVEEQLNNKIIIE